MNTPKPPTIPSDTLITTGKASQFQILNIPNSSDSITNKLYVDQQVFSNVRYRLYRDDPIEGIEAETYYPLIPSGLYGRLSFITIRIEIPYSGTETTIVRFYIYRRTFEGDFSYYQISDECVIDENTPWSYWNNFSSNIRDFLINPETDSLICSVQTLNGDTPTGRALNISFGTSIDYSATSEGIILLHKGIVESWPPVPL
jgi:hypothetical protein